MAETYTTKTLRELIRVVAGRFLGVVAIILIVVVGVAIATYLSPAQYRSEVTLSAQPVGLTNPLEATSTSTRDEVELFITTQRRIITSDYVLASALMRLDGKPIRPELSTRKSADEGEYAWYSEQDIQDFVDNNFKRMRKLRKQVSVVTPGGPEATFTRTFTIRVDWYENSEVAPSGDSSDMTPRELAAQRVYEMAKYVQDAYLMRSAQLRTRQARMASEFIQYEALRVAKYKLDEAVKTKADFVKEYLKGDLTVVMSLTSGRVSGETSVAQVSTENLADINVINRNLAGQRSLKESIDKELAKDDPADIVVPDSVTQSNAVVKAIQEQIVLLKVKIAEMEPRFTSAYKGLTDARSELKHFQNDLKREMQMQSTRLAQAIAVKEAEVDTAVRQYKDDRQKVDRLSVMVVPYENLDKNVEILREQYNEELDRALKASTAKELASRHMLVEVLDPPSHPDPSDPRRPIVWLNLLIAIFGGIVIALVYAFMADHFDHSIKSIDDAERYLGVPVLASVPRVRGKILRT